MSFLRCYYSCLSSHGPKLHSRSKDALPFHMPEPAATSAPAIEFRDVSYTINMRESRPILNGISLSIADGEVVAILGRSGSGKTSLLKLINRILYFTSGDLLVGGKSVSAWDPILLRRGIGYVIQETGLLPHLTVKENVCLVPEL